MLVDRNGADHIPAFEVELVDQTGCGDAFAGALAAYLAVEEDMRKAVEFASAAGALACTKFGSIEAMPTKSEIIQIAAATRLEPPDHTKATLNGIILRFIITPRRFHRLIHPPELDEWCYGQVQRWIPVPQFHGATCSES